MNVDENLSADIIKQQFYVDIYTGIQNRRHVYDKKMRMDTLSLMAFKDAMKEWLTYILLNKSIAFGSDKFGVFLMYTSEENIRDLMAGVSAELYEEG